MQYNNNSEDHSNIQERIVEREGFADSSFDVSFVSISAYNYSPLYSLSSPIDVLPQTSADNVSEWAIFIFVFFGHALTSVPTLCLVQDSN